MEDLCAVAGQVFVVRRKDITWSKKSEEKKLVR